MARRVFYSIHYKSDNWRAAQVRNMGIIEGNQPATDNDWETITRRGNDALKHWITNQMTVTSCIAVLIGTNTASRKWINHEIIEPWNSGKGIVGIYIHNLKDQAGNPSTIGTNPFDSITLRNRELKLSSIIKAHNPPYAISTMVYDYIKQKLGHTGRRSDPYQSRILG